MTTTMTIDTTSTTPGSITRRSTFDRLGEPTIGTYRRPAGCDVRRLAQSSAGTPDYRVRRIAAAAMATVCVATLGVGASALLASFGGDPAVAAETQPGDTSADPVPAAPAVHVARPGDTLWSIAATHRGEVSQSRYVDALVRLNGGATIQAGQSVALP